MNVPVHVVLAARLIEPLAQRPDHPEKVDPVLGVAESVTSVLIAKLAEQVVGQVIPAGADDRVPEPVPALTTVSIACPVEANVRPTRDLTAEMSDAFTEPEALTSFMKVVALAANPERAFTALTSLASTARVLFTSPNKKPNDADAYTAAAPSLSDTVTRELSGTFVKVTVTSEPETKKVGEPIDDPCGSTAVTVVGETAGALNWKTTW